MHVISHCADQARISSYLGQAAWALHFHQGPQTNTHPSSYRPCLRFLTAAKLLADGHVHKATSAIGPLLKGNPRPAPEVLILLARLQRAGGKVTGQPLQDALRQYPNNRDVLNEALSLCASETEKLEFLSGHLQRHPQATIACCWLARMHLSSGYPRKSIETYRNTLHALGSAASSCIPLLSSILVELTRAGHQIEAYQLLSPVFTPPLVAS